MLLKHQVNLTEIHRKDEVKHFLFQSFSESKWITVWPAVHAACDSVAPSSDGTHRGDNVIVLVFCEAVQEQTFFVRQLPEFQSTCPVKQMHF